MPGKLLLTAFVIFVIDRASKHWIVEVLNLKEILSIDVLPPFLNFRMAWNQGINFGILNFGDNGRWVLIAVSVVIAIAVLIWAWKTRGTIVPIAAGCVVGGAIGNIYDRVVYGAVADFLNMSCCGIDNPFAFNVADIAIFAGAFALIFFGDKELKKID